MRDAIFVVAGAGSDKGRRTFALENSDPCRLDRSLRQRLQIFFAHEITE